MGNGTFSKIDVRHLNALVNRYGLCNVQTGLFRTGNVRATTSTPQQSRSESAVAINPNNSDNMVGVSKKFIDPAVYKFIIGVIYTFDGGKTWHESQLPMKTGWDVMTDPAVAFDDFGNAFIVGEPIRFNADRVGTSGDLTGLGMVVYRSSDGGVTWQQPVELTTDTTDDKQWIACDNNPSSPHYGNVYVAWAASSPLRFARSTDHGVHWNGKGSEPAGSSLVSFAFAPELSVSSDGTLHILWHNDNSGTIQYIRSTDGGNSFSPVSTVVTGMSSLRGHLPEIGNWPHFDYGKFRVITLVTDCAADYDVLIVAWADMREGRSRIYYRRSLDNGLTWDGPASGSTLLPNVVYGDMHCFHPQIIATGTGVIGCAFYVFGKEFNHWLIRVQLAASWDDGATFSNFITVTEQSWNPLVNAPLVHGDPNVHFIGEYFGLDAGDDEFVLLWTDTRTGVQELFSDVVKTKRVKCPPIPQVAGEILIGVINDAGGYIIVGGKPKPIPPHSPLVRVLAAIAAATNALENVDQPKQREMQLAALRDLRATVDQEIAQLGGG
jgi:hypothetical protein